jgi:hypothetical protein
VGALTQLLLSDASDRVIYQGGLGEAPCSHWRPHRQGGYHMSHDCGAVAVANEAPGLATRPPTGHSRLLPPRPRRRPAMLGRRHRRLPLGWRAQIRTASGGNLAVFHTLSPLAVPLLFKAQCQRSCSERRRRTISSPAGLGLTSGLMAGSCGGTVTVRPSVPDYSGRSAVSISGVLMPCRELPSARKAASQPSASSDHSTRVPRKVTR